MKRIILVIAFVAILVSPAFSQIRLDIGADIPITAGTISGSGIETSGEIGEFLRTYWFPFPEASLYYQFDLGPVKLAPGIRVFTLILETVLWPNVLAEVQLGPVFIDAQLGGLLFAMFGVYSDADFGKVVLPDLSVWLGLGKAKNFRLGAGCLGMYIPEAATDAMLIVPYVGGKVSILF